MACRTPLFPERQLIVRRVIRNRERSHAQPPSASPPKYPLDIRKNKKNAQNPRSRGSRGEAPSLIRVTEKIKPHPKPTSRTKIYYCSPNLGIFQTQTDKNANKNPQNSVNKPELPQRSGFFLLFCHIVQYVLHFIFVE